MALTEIEKHTIVRHLGWPAKTLLVNSTHYSNWVVSRLTDLTPEIESLVRDLLSRLIKMDEKLEKAVCRAGISEVDGITFREDELRILRNERYRIIKELSQLLDIPIQNGMGMGNVGV